MKKKCVLSFLLAGFFVVTTAVAQVRVSGKVTDANRNAVAGASVHLLNTNEGVVSSGDGSFTINNVLPGRYILQFSAVGFANRSVELRVGNTPVEINGNLLQKSESLEDVVVTAQKREELVQQLPLSLTALTSRNVAEYRLWNSQELTGIVPNFYSADPGDKRNVTSVRGIATTSYDPAIATYVDGVNQFNLDTYIASLFDIERIEVLRGPQGTLYGRNAMGGVINIITKQPTNATRAFAEVNIGNYNTQRYTAGVRTPLVKDKLYFGVAGLYDKINGYYTNAFNNSRYDKQYNIGGNYFLKYIIDPRWAATLNFKHNNNRNNGPFPLVFGVDQAFADPFSLNQNALTTIIDNTINTSLSLNYAGRGFTMNAQTAYQSNYRYYNKPIDADFSPLDALSLINNFGKDWNNVKVFTQELKFSTAAGTNSPFSWTAGTFFFRQNSPTRQETFYGKDALLLGAPDINFSSLNTSTAKSTGIAVYGQVTYNLTNALALTGGLRYDYEEKQQGAMSEYIKQGGPRFPLIADTSASVNFSSLSPKLTLSYQASKNNLLFAGYSRGFRAGGLTSIGQDPFSEPPLFSYKPEYSNNIEAGIKNTIVPDKLLLNLTAFYTTVSNAQVPTLVLPSAIVVTRNTGELSSKGIEAELSAALIKGLEINYSFGYTNAKYNTLKVPGNGTEVDLKGNRQIFTPNVTSMLAAQYSVSLSKAGNLRAVVRGEWKYLGSQYFDLENQIRQAPYQLLNTRFGLSTNKFELMFWGRNLTDRRYIGYAYDFGAVHLGNPKTHGVSLGVRL